MAIENIDTLMHWNYFLSLEEDLHNLNRFVDFSEGNYSTFSLEMARILMAASAEVDVVLKQLCFNITGESSADKIGQYYPIITGRYSMFKNFPVTIPLYGKELKPWTNWKLGASPKWWVANNKVKHQRHQFFQEASLKNCLNAVAALFVSLLYLYRDQAERGDLQQIPKLLNVSEENFGGTSMGRYGHSFRYKNIF